MPESNPYHQTSVKDYWDILIRRRWIVISFCAICTMIVVIASLLMTPLYRATATVVVEGEDTNVVTGYESAAAAGTSIDIFENYLETQMELILSRNVAGKVFEEFKLADTEMFQKRKNPLKLFLSLIHLKRVKGTRIIHISFDYPDPELSSEIANRLAEVYAQDNLMRRALVFIRNQRMASLNADYLRLQSKLDSLSNVYGPKHPEMVALKDEIKAMARQIEKERLKQNKGEADLTQVSADEKTLLENALLKIQENSVMSSARMKNVIIMDRAVVPIEKYSPKRTLNTLIGFMGGLVGGIFLAFVVNYLDDTIKTEEDLKRYADNVPFLGSLYTEKTDRNPVASHFNMGQLMVFRSESPSAEVYRLVRMGIQWVLRKDENHTIKDLAVLSPGPGEGKTTVASNLAIAMSQINMKVLLVDCDIRRGKMHDTYYLENNSGIGQYLTGDLQLNDVIQKTAITNLSVVTCGESAIDSSQLFSSPRMSKFIQEVRNRFDIVLYDTPPVTLISDTAILISQIESAVLITRSGVTPARMLLKAFSILNKSGTKLMGVVLNDISPVSERSYYSKYYSKKTQTTVPPSHGLGHGQ